MRPASIAAAVSSLALCARIAQGAATNEANSSTASHKSDTVAILLSSRPHLGRQLRACRRHQPSATGSGRSNREAAHVAGRPLSNVLENVLMAMLPMGIIYTLGIMLNRLKQA